MKPKIDLSTLDLIRSPVLIIRKDDLKILFANLSAQTKYNYRISEFTSKNFIELCDPLKLNKNPFFKYSYQSISNEELNDRIWVHITKKNKPFYALSKANECDFEDEVCYLISIIDISHQIFLRKKYDSLLNALMSSSLVLIVNQQGIIEQVSELYETVSGFTYQDLVNRHFDKFHLDIYHNWNVILDNIKNYGAYVHVYCRKTNFNKNFWSLDYIHEIYLESNISSYICIGFDITEIILSKEQKNKLLSLLSDYSQIASHEFRGPISTIMALSELLDNDMITKDEYLFTLNDKLQQVDDIIKSYSKKIDLLDSPRESFINY